jgi:predicted ATPase
LSPISSPEELPVERIVAALQARPTLLVLDNFEHVTEAAHLLKTLLSRVPSLKLLVTSQHRLHVAAEREIVIGSLPTAKTADSFEEILETPSIQLFIDRAQLARPDFQLSPHNAADVVNLCSTLEGVPLAIELAAARAGVLSPRQIATQLQAARDREGGRLDYLQNPKQPSSHRHLSLRTAISWSYDLLPPDLAKLWTELSVFRGSFSSEAAQVVCQQPGIVHALGQLRACSLLTMEDHGLEARFRCPELLREYATEALKADPQRATDAPCRHAEYFCDLFADLVLQLRTPNEAEALRQAALEADNARAALEWTQCADKGTVGAALALSFGTTLQRRGLHAEALYRLEHGVDVTKILPPEYGSIRSSLLREAAGVHLDLMQWDHALRDATELRKLSEELGDPKGATDAINLLGLAAKSQRQWKRAREYFAQASTEFENIGDTVGLAHTQNNLGLIEYLDPRGNKKAAGNYFREALRLRFELNDTRGVAEAFINLGALEQQNQNWDSAERYYREALDIEQRLQHIFGIGRALCNLGEIAENRGRREQAFRLFIAAQCLFEQAGIAYQEYSCSCAARLATGLRNATSLRAEARHLVGNEKMDDLIEWAIAAVEA